MKLYRFKIVSFRWERNLANIPEHTELRIDRSEYVGHEAQVERHVTIASQFLLVLEQLLVHACKLPSEFTVPDTQRKLPLRSILGTHFFDTENAYDQKTNHPLINIKLSKRLTSLYQKVVLEPSLLEIFKENPPAELIQIQKEIQLLLEPKSTHSSSNHEILRTDDSDDDKEVIIKYPKRETSSLLSTQCDELLTLMIMQDPEKIDSKFAKEFWKLLQEKLCPKLPMFQKGFLSPIKITALYRGDIYREIHALCINIKSNNEEQYNLLIQTCQTFSEHLTEGQSNTLLALLLNAFTTSNLEQKVSPAKRKAIEIEI